MLAQVERPGRALLSAEEAAALGFSMRLLGLTVLNAAMHAVKRALRTLADGAHPPAEALMPFDEDMSVRQDRIFGVDFGHANGNSIAGLESDLDRLG